MVGEWKNKTQEKEYCIFANTQMNSQTKFNSEEVCEKFLKRSSDINMSC